MGNQPDPCSPGRDADGIPAQAGSRCSWLLRPHKHPRSIPKLTFGLLMKVQPNQASVKFYLPGWSQQCTSVSFVLLLFANSHPARYYFQTLVQGINCPIGDQGEAWDIANVISIPMTPYLKSLYNLTQQHQVHVVGLIIAAYFTQRCSSKRPRNCCWCRMLPLMYWWVLLDISMWVSLASSGFRSPAQGITGYYYL